MLDASSETGCEAALADVFSASLVGDPGLWCPAQVLDLSARTVGLFFAAPVPPVLRIGQECSLRLEAMFLERPLLLAVRITLRMELSGGRHYECEILDAEAFLHQLPGFARRCLSAADPPPVRPDPRAPVFASLSMESSPTEERGRVEELSSAGLTLAVAGRSEQELGAADQVRVALRLPTTPERLGLWGTIRQRRLTRVAIRYAVAFDAGRTWRFEWQREQIEAYLRERRRQLTR